MNFNILLGQTLTKIEGLKPGSDDVYFIDSLNRTFVLTHFQECCEDVSVADVVGDLEDLLDSPILLAEEVCSEGEEEEEESCTWTYYKLSTIKGSVTISWRGTSNGYYSEGVTFHFSPVVGQTYYCEDSGYKIIIKHTLDGNEVIETTAPKGFIFSPDFCDFIIPIDKKFKNVFNVLH